ncbi:MAG: hypothetical protein IKN52_01125, partial [Victivallales bacterium]|nr:hypothetical protein [Victivallales bacterium]
GRRRYNKENGGYSLPTEWTPSLQQRKWRIFSSDGVDAVVTTKNNHNIKLKFQKERYVIYIPLFCFFIHNPL